MDKFVSFMNIIISFMRRKYLIFGFSFSYFDIFMFSILGYLIFTLIGGLMRTGD